ncbi:MAG TPA: DUF5818 domain-containing protein [Candidatus Dormibacteraeota bacterium]|nr:DUF5818 domain-containing protein [Candidatus Dormibacteraeota bacterium]
MKSLLRLAVLLSFAAGMAALSVRANSQQPARDSQRPTAAQSQNNMQPEDAKPFSGTIVKEKGKFVLKDQATKSSYQLDDQEKAKQFEGKQVKVIGKLDVETNLIHVENIEPVS